MIDTKRPIGVVGAGILGTQITAHLQHCGYSVILKTRSLDRRDIIIDMVERLRRKYINNPHCQWGGLDIVDDFQKMGDCQVVIEAVVEDMGIKSSVLRDVENVLRPEAFIFTNSSSISIDSLANELTRPERFLGFHFFNPISRMGLIEIVVGEHTCETALDHALMLARAIEKDPVVVRNSPGFIVNRLLLWQINEATRMVEEGVASIEDVDKAVRLGLNHPLGPFQLADLIGLDVCLSILEVLHHDLGLSGYLPSDTMVKMVREGRIGRKAGEGFYSYRT